MIMCAEKMVFKCTQNRDSENNG